VLRCSDRPVRRSAWTVQTGAAESQAGRRVRGEQSR
jgi:hypothetical protein